MSDRYFSPRCPRYPNSLYGVVRRRFKELGVHGSPQSLRASALTRFVRSGGAIATAENLAGHQSIDTTALYARQRPRLTVDDVQWLTP